MWFSSLARIVRFVIITNPCWILCRQNMRRIPVFCFLGLRTDSDAATDSSYFFPLEYNAGKDVHYIAEIFKATITPEVFVVDSSNRVWYSGAIDNWSFDTGKKRQFATEHYLKDALKALRNGQKPAVSETKAVGCYIE